MTTSDCPFCSISKDRIVREGQFSIALSDGFPVSPGHTLVVPKRHISDWFAATKEERAEILDLIDVVKKELDQRHKPDGYNIGINIGAAAGQTINHLHVHLIPRYEADVQDPRGGVRYVIPEKARYWED
jgi:diadenosine tetraphosphate (Ap4A) HIT family hydrolase